jgi:hypothetical protein
MLPGSVHDQRVFQNSVISKTPTDFFSTRDYLIGDSAYTATSYLVPAYKKFSDQIILFAGQAFFMTYFHLFVLTLSILLEYGKVGFPSLETFVLTLHQRKI